MGLPSQVSVPVFEALVPLLHVASIRRSIAFYESLGFRATNVSTPPDHAEPGFASMDSGGARLMLVRGHPINAHEQGVILTLYCNDVAATHAMLHGAGVRVEEITYPAERPDGRFRLADPDGYSLAITHL